MFKSRVWFLFFILVAFTYCSEEEVDLRGTSPTVNFSFVRLSDNKPIMPDSVLFSGTDSIRYFQDTVSTYTFPVNYKSEETDFFIFIDTIFTGITLKYDVEVVNDIDKIRYQANLKEVLSSPIDSLAIECQDTIKCDTDGATIKLFY